MNKPFLSLLLLVTILVSSCRTKGKTELLAYTTDSDSTLFYYRLGWEQIMDWGDYSAAETSYRKALSFDENFLVGKSVLARLTTDLEERLGLYHELDSLKNTVLGDERLVLDVYIALTQYTNLRDQKSDQTASALQAALKIGEENLRTVVHYYPNEVYLKSEYIEIMHSLYGSDVALDTMKSIILPSQMDNPFLMGYKAIMLAELEKYDSALVIAKALTQQMEGSRMAKPDTILADIYFKMGELEQAKTHADKANLIDPNNLDASRLKRKIDTQLGL
ncbi:MAG: tetratricopeptide (TPR) repeat protein [Roseivirga sp.]|jgi:tetratricopeptide (TPR) repeat protein